jgi:hypothetical protein
MSEVDWEQLRAPFPPEQTGKLPKAGIELDYVGHAFITERLNEFGGDWVMEPVGDVQFPGLDLCWLQVRLTVGGVARYEVGCADPRKQEFPKLLWSDCLTRAAMRHGIALALWQKETPLAQDRPTTRENRSTAARGTAARSTAQLHDPDLTALVDLLKEDVAQLDQTGLDAWAAWKADHAGWWTTTALAIAARDCVMGLLAAGTTEPWAAAPDVSGADPY